MSNFANEKPDLCESENNFRGSQTFGRENFKTFTLLRQQDDFISKFESNLQKTLELVSDQSTKENKPHELQDKRSVSPSLQNFRRSESENLRDQTDYRNTDKPPLSVKDLKSSSTKDLLAELRSSGDGHDKNESSQDRNSSLNKKMEDLGAENERLRSEIIKIKTDSLKKYEQLKKNNDELLLSYEERSKITIKNMKEQHEAEIGELREEIEQLKEENQKGKENLKRQKERMGLTIMELEKEKQELLSKISRVPFKNVDIVNLSSPSIHDQHGERTSVSSNANSNMLNASGFVLEQIIKEKNELEKRYNDLFSSYNVLLEHNKALSEKFKSTEREETDQKKSKLKKEKLTTEPELIKTKSKEEATQVRNPAHKIPTSATKASKKDIDNFAQSSFLSAQKDDRSQRSASSRQSKIKESSASKLKEPSMVLEDLKSFDDSSRHRLGESYADTEYMLLSTKSKKPDSEKKGGVRSSSTNVTDKENKPQSSTNIRKDSRKSIKDKDKKEGTPAIPKPKTILKENQSGNIANSAKKESKTNKGHTRSASKDRSKENQGKKSQSKEGIQTEMKSSQGLNSSKKIPLYSKVSK